MASLRAKRPALPAPDPASDSCSRCRHARAAGIRNKALQPLDLGIAVGAVQQHASDQNFGEKFSSAPSCRPFSRSVPTSADISS